MIICSECETPQFLQIEESTIRFEAGEPGSIHEKYRCTNCDGVGRYWYLSGEECVNGGVEIIDERPRMDH